MSSFEDQQASFQQNDQSAGIALRQKAIKYHMDGDLLNAEKIYREAISIGYLDSAIFANLGVICNSFGRVEEAISLYNKAIDVDHSDFSAHYNLGGIYLEIGEFEQALTSTLKSLELNSSFPDALINLGCIYRELGYFDQALASCYEAIELKPEDSNAHATLSCIHHDLSNLDQALASCLTSLDLNPNNPNVLINLGAIYKKLGQFDLALSSTLKSLDLSPNNYIAFQNLGLIYQDLSDNDQSLAFILKSLELAPNNPSSLRCLYSLVTVLDLNTVNLINLTKSFEILISLNNISHQQLSRVFVHLFYQIFLDASHFNPIISFDNTSLLLLASDWRILKSLSLFTIPSQSIEVFFTRLRRELLFITSSGNSIQEPLRPLLEALAIHCFLNEYVYSQQLDEIDLVYSLIRDLSENHKSFYCNLSVIGCYLSIYSLSTKLEWLTPCLISSVESNMLIQVQLEEPREEALIKSSFQACSNVNDPVSLKVQEMYELNPYPRYRFAQFVDKSLVNTACDVIKKESTISNLRFTEKLITNASHVNLLIAGCGTGSQVIDASRYKNVNITAIDLSSSSLAYAIRKSKEYAMENVSFFNMDLLKLADLGQVFDIIECGGVLHHLHDPSQGLSALLNQLQPGGYIKLAVYSEIARKEVISARKQISNMHLSLTTDSIRKFRSKVFEGVFKDLLSLPDFGTDFFSISSCRDLCFHVQEHRFTIQLLQEFLDSKSLLFCGFLLPDSIRSSFRQQFPSDHDMTSLQNWDLFEKQNPYLFSNMYQFWAQKPFE